MCEKREVIHCDKCGTIVMTWEGFCSWCRRERKDFIWLPVEIDSDAWWGRCELKDPSRGNYEMTPFHCDSCYSVISFISDRFCGFCGKNITAIEWPYMEDLADPEFLRREELRKAASPDVRRVKSPILDIDTRK